MRIVLSIIKRVASGVGTGSSQACNYIWLKGSPYQTVSAHCHVNPDLRRLRQLIDFIAAPFEADHCAKASSRDLTDARKRLAASMGVSSNRLIITVSISPDAPASHHLP